MPFSERPPFYLVWSAKTGRTWKRHSSLEIAIAEASRLAKTYPGDKFHVLLRLGRAVEPKSVLTETQGADNV